jgi:hypothetical protein
MDAAQRERQGRRRRGIKPLQIVYGDKHRVIAREAPNNAQQGHADRAYVEPPRTGILLQQRDGKRKPLRLGQLSAHLVPNVRKQVP